MTPHTKKKAPAKGAALEAATDKLMKAWAEWHNTPDRMPSVEVLNAVAEIFEARGMDFSEGIDGSYYVHPAKRGAK